LCDMVGNVWELCNDWYGWSYYGSSPFDNPQGPVSGMSRVIRGGSWGYGADALRCAVRGYNSPEYRYTGSGFRLVSGN